MSVFFFTAFFMVLLLCAFLCLYRLQQGPTAPDRTVAIDVLGTLVVGFCALYALRTGKEFYLNAVMEVRRHDRPGQVPGRESFR